MTAPALAVKERPALFSGTMPRAILDDRKTQTRRIVKPQPDHLQVHKHKGKTIYDGEHRMWCWKHLVLENIWDFPDNDDRRALADACPYGKPGDRLWVKETFASPSKYIVAYKAGAECGAWIGDGGGGQFWNHHGFIIESTDYHDVASKSVAGACRTFGLAKYGGIPRGEYPHTYGWRPSIHMPRWASRITLDITEVRVQKLGEISEEDAIAEGIRSQILPDLKGNRWHWGDKTKGRYASPIAAFQALWVSINGSWNPDQYVWAITFKRIGGEK